MVRFHGGGFTTGSGSSEMNGPDFIVNERVILVTLNYRLSVFGKEILSLQELPFHIIVGMSGSVS